MALDAATGQELWTAPGLPSYGGLLAVGDGVVVVQDADVIGGLRVEIGDDVIDGTVAGRLDDARRRLAG